MNINIFEGARRIGLLVGCLWAVGFVVHAVFEDPYAVTVYAVERPGSIPTLAESCSPESQSETITRKAAGGEIVRIELCFVAKRADNGEMYIPFELTDDGRKWIGNSKYSEKVMNYVRTVSRLFELTEEVAVQAKASKRKALFIQWRDAMAFLIGGLIFGWLSMTAIGWIVRGFLRIPKGKDSRTA